MNLAMTSCSPGQGPKKARERDVDGDQDRDEKAHLVAKQAFRKYPRPATDRCTHDLPDLLNYRFCKGCWTPADRARGRRPTTLNRSGPITGDLDR